MVKRVCLVSGGTGGHLVPALALADALSASGHDPVLVTSGRAVENELLAGRRPELTRVDLGAGRPSLLGLPLWLWRTTRRARELLREQQIDAVVATGGRTSLPVGLAARSLGRPLFLLEQNAVTGRANRCLLPFARRLYLGLPARERPNDRALLTGTPVRREFYQADRAQARLELDLPADGLVVLVTGGSQGARSLNEIVPLALCGVALPMHVLHLAGAGRDEEVRRTYAEFAAPDLTAQVRPVTREMDRLIAAADLVICRGGGTTVAELMAAGRPSVIVPYPFHRDQQQLRNAEVLAAAGAAVVVQERELGVADLRATLGKLLVDRTALQAMGLAARRLRAEDPCGAILCDMAQHGGLG